MSVAFVQSELISIKHGFFTRHGGVSDAPYQSLNVAKHVPDDHKNVDENRRLALTTLHVKPERFVFLGLLEHSNRIFQITEAAAGKELSDHDVLMTDVPNLALGLSTADCMPIILVDESAPAIALVHAGWRGLVVNVIPQAVQALVETYDVKRERLQAVIGPAIAQASYEVQKNVAKKFDARFSKKTPTGYLLDLPAVAEDQLAQAGVTHIENLHIDTAQDERFFSHRASGGETGRFLTLASL